MLIRIRPGMATVIDDDQPITTRPKCHAPELDARRVIDDSLHRAVMRIVSNHKRRIGIHEIRRNSPTYERRRIGRAIHRYLDRNQRSRTIGARRIRRRRPAQRTSRQHEEVRSRCFTITPPQPQTLCGVEPIGVKRQRYHLRDQPGRTSVRNRFGHDILRQGIYFELFSPHAHSADCTRDAQPMPSKSRCRQQSRPGLTDRRRAVPSRTTISRGHQNRRNGYAGRCRFRAEGRRPPFCGDLVGASL